MSRPAIEVRAAQVTPRARAWLTASGPVRFLHIFDAVCNLMDTNGALISVQSERIPPAPISLTINSQDLTRAGVRRFGQWLDANTPAQRQGPTLRLGRLVVNWGSATEWDPRPAWDEIRATCHQWSNQLPLLLGALRSAGPAGGLSGLLGGQLSRPEPDAALADPWIAAARAPAGAVLGGLGTSQAEDLAIEGAGALAGLGTGLTPAGDDFLIGVMHALWATRNEAAASEISDQLAEAAAPRTTPLSAAWLLAAADGEAAGYWHDLLSALVEGTPEAIEASCRRLLSVGHSSGADALTGFLGVLLGPSRFGFSEGT